MAKKEQSNLPIAGLAGVAIAAATVLFVSEIPYLEIRPAQKQVIDYEMHAAQRVNARLWQDPFAAVGDYERSEFARNKFDSDSRNFERQGDATAPPQFLDHRFGVSLDYAKAYFGKLKHPHAKSSDAGGAPQSSPAREPPRPGAPVGAASLPTLTVLEATMQGGPSVGGEEQRRRERYAVVSALGAAGYRPRDDEHIGYAVVHSSDLLHGASSDSMRVVFEVFERALPGEIVGPPPPDGTMLTRAASEHVLVLWIDDSLVMQGFTNWLQQLRALNAGLLPCSSDCQVRLIGPSSSDSWAELIDSDKPDGETPGMPDSLETVAKLRVFSPFVTSTIREQSLKGVDLTATIPNDERVLETLVGELDVRGIPLCAKDQRLRDTTDGLILLREWDTQYARRAANTLANAIQAKCEHDNRGAPIPIHTYSFARGLDGALVSPLSTASAPANADAESHKSPLQIEWPETSDQRDYIRRLGDRIVLDGRGTTSDHSVRRNVSAIGILSSDTHDKLLLLQALRDKFPETLFFTADADARLAHPQVHRWTRNLILASGYGLSLPSELQATTPPFRDVYQASTYLATLLALRPDSERDNVNTLAEAWTAHTELFEVGRTRLVPLDLKYKALGIAEEGLFVDASRCDVQSLDFCAGAFRSQETDQLDRKERWVVMALVIGMAGILYALALRRAFSLPQRITCDDQSEMHRFMGALIILSSFLLTSVASLVFVLVTTSPKAGAPLLSNRFSDIVQWTYIVMALAATAAIVLSISIWRLGRRPERYDKPGSSDIRSSEGRKPLIRRCYSLMVSVLLASLLAEGLLAGSATGIWQSILADDVSHALVPAREIISVPAAAYSCFGVCCVIAICIAILKIGTPQTWTYMWKDYRRSALYLGIAVILLALLLVAVGVVIVLAGTAAGIWHPFNPGEPLALAEGVSSVPVALCWCLAFTLTIFFQFRIITTAQSRFHDLQLRFLGTARNYSIRDDDPDRSLLRWAGKALGPRQSSGSTEFSRTWALYRYHSFSSRRLLRIIAWAFVIYVIPMTLLTAWLPDPQFPVRGSMHLIVRVITIAGFTSLMLLMVTVADTVLLCSLFVLAIGKQRNNYPYKVRRGAAARYSLLSDMAGNVDALLDTEIIGERTAMIADYLYYPFVVMGILSLGLVASLESWTRWPGRFVIICLSTALVTILWLALRKSTERARAGAMEELQESEMRIIQSHAGAPVIRGALLRQAYKLRQRIRSTRAGAYAALMDQPIVRAVLLPIAGAGAAQIWQHISERLN